MCGYAIEKVSGYIVMLLKKVHDIWMCCIGSFRVHEHTVVKGT